MQNLQRLRPRLLAVNIWTKYGRHQRERGHLRHREWASASHRCVELSSSTLLLRVHHHREWASATHRRVELSSSTQDSGVERFQFLRKIYRPEITSVYARCAAMTSSVRRRNVRTIVHVLYPLGLPRLDALVLMKAVRGDLQPQDVMRHLLSRNPVTNEMRTRRSRTSWRTFRRS